MDLQELTEVALRVQARFDEVNDQRRGGAWTTAEIALGFATDLGDLARLLMVREGRRDPRSDLDLKLQGELADCLWSVLVLAHTCQVDLEAAFSSTMNDILADGDVARDNRWRYLL